MTKNKTKNYLFFVTIIIADVILVILLIWLVTQSNSLSEQNALLKGQLDDITAKKSTITNNKTEALRFAESFQVLNKYFTTSDQKVLLFVELEKLANQAGISYNLNNATEATRIYIDMNIKGSFQNIYHFIRLLETNGYWVSFEKILLVRGTEKGVANWSGSIVINIPNLDN